MPLFNYYCEDCKTTHEMLLFASAPDLKRCPDCGQTNLKKLVSKPNLTGNATTPCGSKTEMSCADQTGGCGGCCGGH